MSDRNPMTVREVHETTQVAIDSGYKNDNGQRDYSVHALKDCGCQGPWLGRLKRISYSDWTEEMKEAANKADGGASCWAFYPVTKSDRYKTYARPQGWAFGRVNAAKKLRDWHIQQRRRRRMGTY